MRSIKFPAPGVVFAAFALLLCNSCDDRTSSVGPEGWLSGTTDEKFDAVARHFRGNDLVMWEIERRHRELGRAIATTNWGFADYQIQKIHQAMKMGYERRPKRRPSYDWFFAAVIPPMKEAVASSNIATATVAYTNLTLGCIQCHALEKVPFMPVSLGP